MLHRKLRRDLLSMKGQVATIALVVASATGGFVGSLGTYHALQQARAAFYAHYRFANVFVDVKRAPRALLQRVANIPGVVDSEANVVADSQLFLSGVPEPLIAHLVGITTGTGPRLNRLYIRRGRMIEPGATLEALVDEGFAAARHLGPGDEVTVLLNGIRQQLKIVGVGLSPEYINPSIGGAFPDPKGLGVFWIDGERLADSFDLKEAFNHLSVVTASSASESQVLNDLDVLLRQYGGRGAYGRKDQTSDRIVSQEMNQQRVLGTVMPSLFVWVAAFLLNVVLGRQIATQREQIAALKALGFGNGAIALYYLEFVAIVVSCGMGLASGIGAWFGSYMTGMYADFFHFPAVSFRIEPGADCRGRRRLYRGRFRRSALRDPANHQALTCPSNASSCAAALSPFAPGATRNCAIDSDRGQDDSAQPGAPSLAFSACRGRRRRRRGIDNIRDFLVGCRSAT